MSNKTLIILIIILCLVIGAGVGAYFYLSKTKPEEIYQEETITPYQEKKETEEQKQPQEQEKQPQKEIEKEQPQKEKEKPIPLPKYPWKGEYPFRVSSTKGVYPKFKSGKFSKRPMDIIGDVDKELKTSIKIEDPDGVSKVTLLIIGHKDNLRKEIELKLTDGDPKLGTWSAKFEIPKEMKRIFWTKFYAQNNKGKIEDLSLDWRPGATCPVATSGNQTFGTCNCAGGEVVGSDDGQITVTGTVNLSGASSNPAYMVFGTKVTFSGGKITFSAHDANGKATAILIKKGKTDSVKSKAAAICAFYDNIKCNPDGGYYDDGADSPSGTNYCKHNYYQCSSGSCATLTATDATCGTCCYCSGSSCSNYSSATQGPTADYYYDNGGDSASGTNYCVLRNYHCTGSSCAETYGDSTIATCGLCRYCNGSSCGTYGNGTGCGSNKVCRSGSCVTNYVVVLNCGTGKNCNTICSENGSRTCRSVGVNADGTGGQFMSTDDADPQNPFCRVSNSGTCSYPMVVSYNLNCSGHRPDWENCRCSYY